MMDLNQIPVTRVSGVGPQKAEDLAALGIHTAAQLIAYFPFRYEDYRLRDLSEVKDGERITVQGNLIGAPVLQRYGRKSRLSCKVVIDHFFVTAVWFNRPFLKDKLASGKEIRLTGKWDARRKQLTVSESEFPGNDSLTGTLQPVYSLTGSLTQKSIRKMIQQALKQFGNLIQEVLPADFVKRYQLLPRKQAVALIHQPSGLEDGKQARRRMVYEELFSSNLKCTHLKL